MAELNFNAGDQEGMDDYSVLPAGPYNVQVVKSEVVPTKDTTGTLLKLQFKVIDGKFKGRIVFGQYNLTNKSSQAVEISRKQMKTLCDAIGKPNGVGDSVEMHNIPLQIKLKIAPASGVYAEKNEVIFYAKYEGPTIEGAQQQGASGNPAGGNPAGGNPAGGNTEAAPAQAEATEEKAKGAPWG